MNYFVGDKVMLLNTVDCKSIQGLQGFVVRVLTTTKKNPWYTNEVRSHEFTFYCSPDEIELVSRKALR